jgi:zearalenone synthase (nonreducing iterative type I polyketide synthase)
MCRHAFAFGFVDACSKKNDTDSHRCAENEPGLFGAPGREVHILGLCGGLLNAATMVVAHDVSSLYQISLEIIVVTCRLSNVMYSRSRAVENTSGSWGWSVLGLDSTHLQRVLDQFHDKRVSSPGLLPNATMPLC